MKLAMSQLKPAAKNFPESGAWCAQLCEPRADAKQSRGGERPCAPDAKERWRTRWNAVRA